MISVHSGIQRFAEKVVNLDEQYCPYPMQALYHASPARHRFIGGSAGPGKTTCGIFDHLIACNEFNADDAKQVHTLLLRRTHPKCEQTLITRFREKIPRELYRDYNESKHIVTWLNGATSHFGSMQHEHDVYGWQGQWFKIFYDELCEFTFKQWVGISAWNRCAVSPYCTKDGAGNPIGIGAGFVENLFVRHVPTDEMDELQRQNYKTEDYAFFPCTYLDNPVYANDPIFLANLDSYQAAIRDALKYGKWGIAGGYFQGAWDEASNVYQEGSVKIEPWWIKWLGGDWGFSHNSAIHWKCLDESGIVRIYRELVVNQHTPEELGESIVKHSVGPDGELEKYQLFSFSHDAFAQKQDINPIGQRIGKVLSAAGLCAATASTKDKRGREQIIYDYLKARVKVGAIYDDEQRRSVPIEVAKLQISSSCKKLIDCIRRAPRDEDNPEEIAEFLGDDPLQSVGYGLYAKFGKPSRVPAAVVIERKVAEFAKSRGREVEEMDLNTVAQLHRRATQQEKLRRNKRRGGLGRIWRPQN